jgi:hypothetical protein
MSRRRWSLCARYVASAGGPGDMTGATAEQTAAGVCSR